MNYNKRIKALKESFVEDGMGGGSYQEQVLKDDIKCALAPIKKEIIDSAGRPILFNRLKVFTKENLSNAQDLIFEYEGVRYSLFSFVDYGKVALYELEVMKNESRE